MIKFRSNEAVEIPTWILVGVVLIVVATSTVAIYKHVKDHELPKPTGAPLSTPNIGKPSLYTKH